MFPSIGDIVAALFGPLFWGAESMRHPHELTCAVPVVGTTRKVGSDALLFVTAQPGWYTFDTCGSHFDTYLELFRLEPGSDETNLLSSATTRNGKKQEQWLRSASSVGECDDCGDCGAASMLSLELTPGRYAVVVSGFQQAQGQFSACIFQAGFRFWYRHNHWT